MAVTSGFFNALNGDRKYFARQMAEMFMGVLGEGVFATIGTAFAATLSEQSNTINVGIGKSWFKNMWIYNDSILPIVLPESELLLDRWDAIILDHNNNEEVRDGTIFVIKGNPSSSPVYPDLTRTQYHDQRATTYIFRPANSSEILQEHIRNNVGMEDCPFITGFLDTVDVEVFLQQWNDKTEEKLAELQEAIDNIIVGASVMLKEEFQALQQEPGVVDKSADAQAHISNFLNPHKIRYPQIGMNAIDVTSKFQYLYPPNATETFRYFYQIGNMVYFSFALNVTEYNTVNTLTFYSITDPKLRPKINTAAIGQTYNGGGLHITIPMPGYFTINGTTISGFLPYISSSRHVIKVSGSYIINDE